MTDPNPPRHVAVIDIGKTNAKLVLHDLLTRRDLGMRTAPNEICREGPYPHFDTEALFAFILDGLASLAAEQPPDAISISAHGAAAALVDDAGELALPVLDYEHPLEDADAYEAVRPSFDETLSPSMANGLNVGRQLFWLQARFPERFGHVRHILFQPQYWAFRLTGVVASEATSLGCHTDLWSPPSRDFSSLVDRMDWRRLFPPLRSAFDRLGPLKPELASRIGLGGRSIPVACGIHDSNASLLPHLLYRPSPFTLLSTGTWVVMFAVGGEATDLAGDRNTLAHVDAFRNPVPAASFMGGREFDLLTDGEAVAVTEEVLASCVARGIMALPPIVAGSGPFPHRLGGWRANAANLGAAERTAAASLYLALTARESLLLIGARGPLVVEGPLARNGLFLRALGQLMRSPVLAHDEGTGASTGAALLVRPQRHGDGATVLPGDDVAAASIPGLIEYAAEWRRQVGCDTGAANVEGRSIGRASISGG